MKYVVVTGGVISGLGKGISISSLAALFKAAGVVVTAIKIDPYLNLDAGTMSPMEHGEVFVLGDGGEADLDLGNYERFMGLHLSRDHNITTGKVYTKVLEAERRGDYLGKTVQIIPHVTDAVQEWIETVAQRPVGHGNSGPTPEVCFIELGGTVGDIESTMFLEALRQFRAKKGRDNVVFVHVSLVPVLGSGEQKTKPTQHSVRQMMSAGIQPDVVLCRCRDAIDEATRMKLAFFCGVEGRNLLTVADVSNIYHVPLLLHAQGAATNIGRLLGMDVDPTPGLDSWKFLAASVDNAEKEVRIALVGKYTGLQDSYLSVLKALKHSAIACARRLVVDWVESEDLEGGEGDDAPSHCKEAWEALRRADGILVPGGFGNRGVNGKVAAIHYARTTGKPFLGVCLGLQCAVIEYARSVLGWEGANSAEFDAEAPYRMVVQMSEIDPTVMGGTMRLGSKPTLLCGVRDADSGEVKQSLAHLVYSGQASVAERHRHRYEVNPAHVPALVKAGLRFSGTDEAGQRMEIIELPQEIHPFFLATQYHPEFLTRPTAPSPPFFAFVSSASGLGLPAAAVAAANAVDRAATPVREFKLPAAKPAVDTGATSGVTAQVHAVAPATPPRTAGAGAGAGAGARSPLNTRGTGSPLASVMKSPAPPPSPLATAMAPPRIPRPSPSNLALDPVGPTGGADGAAPRRERTQSMPLSCGSLVSSIHH